MSIKQEMIEIVTECNDEIQDQFIDNVIAKIQEFDPTISVDREVMKYLLESNLNYVMYELCYQSDFFAERLGTKKQTN